MELLRIVGCLHLSNRCPRDADFYIIGDLENHGVAVHAVDGAVDARGGDDLIAVLHRPQHLLHFLALPLLRQYHQEIHDPEHEAEGPNHLAQTKTAAGLPEKKCCQIHVPNCSIPFRVFPDWTRWHNLRPAAPTGRREYHSPAGEFPLPFPLDSPAETRLVRVARALERLTHVPGGSLQAGPAA